MDVDDQCSPLIWTYYQHEQGLDELKQSLLSTTWELEMTVLSAKEELSVKECELIRLNEILSKTIKERNELQLRCHALQQQNTHLLLLQKHNNADISAASSGSSEEGESNTSSISTAEQILLPESIKELIGDKPLPTKGRLLQAVMEAGPLLETILLAGPLPQWEHPPQLNFVDIPLVPISINPTKYTDQGLMTPISQQSSKNSTLAVGTHMTYQTFITSKYV